LDCEEGWVPKNWCFWTVVLEKTLESPLDCKEIQPVHSKVDKPWVFFGRNDAKAEPPVLWTLHAKSWLIGKESDAERDWGQEEKGTTEDEMAGWHHWLDGRESQWTPGVGDGQGGLACCDYGVEKSRTRLSDWSDLIWFTIWITFIYFSCFIAVPKTYNTMLNRTYSTYSTVRVSILVLFQILTGKLSAFHHWVWYWLEVCQKLLLSCWDVFGLYLLWQAVFNHEWMFNFIRCSICMYWDDHLVFLLFMWCITLIDLCMLNYPVNSGWIPLGCGVWSIVCVVGFGLLIFCWEFLHLSSSKILACNFFGAFFVWFWYQSNGGFIEHLCKCFLLFSLLKEFERGWYKFFFVFLVEFACEA